MKITFFAYLFYIVVALLDNWLLGGTKQFNFSLSQIIHVVLYSVPGNIPAQLWFLIALLEVYVVYFFIDILHARKIAYVVAVITFIAMIFFAQVSLFCGYQLGPDYYRNAWIEGFSFFTLGYFLHDKQDLLSIGNKTLITVIIVSIILSVVESFVVGRPLAVQLSTYPLVTSLFIYAINNSNKHEGVLQRIGMKYSMWVYILHIFFWCYLDKFFMALGCSDNLLVLWLRPFIVLGLTLLTSVGVYALLDHKIVKHNKKQVTK